MSWSFHATGAAGAVRKKAREDFGRGTCAQPEESIRQAAGLALDMSLAALPDQYPVTVEASGSQSGIDGELGKYSNNLTFKVTPIYGYVK